MKVPEALQCMFSGRIYSTKSDHDQHNHRQHSGICPMRKQSVIKKRFTWSFIWPPVKSPQSPNNLLQSNLVLKPPKPHPPSKQHQVNSSEDPKPAPKALTAQFSCYENRVWVSQAHSSCALTELQECLTPLNTQGLGLKTWDTDWDLAVPAEHRAP